MVRATVFQDVGGFDEKMRIWEDADLFLRVGRSYGVAFVDSPIANRRVGHPSLVTSVQGPQEYNAAYQHMYAKYRRLFGSLEFFALKAQARLLPLTA